MIDKNLEELAKLLDVSPTGNLINWVDMHSLKYIAGQPKAIDAILKIVKRYFLNESRRESSPKDVVNMARAGLMKSIGVIEDKRRFTIDGIYDILDKNLVNCYPSHSFSTEVIRVNPVSRSNHRYHGDIFNG